MEETPFTFCSPTVRKSALRNLKSAIILCAMLFALCPQAQAQQSASIPVIGVFLPDTALAYASYVEALLQGLHDLGYVAGRNRRPAR